MTIDNIYNARILDYAGNIERIGRLEDRHATAKAHSKLCGSTVIVDIKAERNPRGQLVVTDFAHDVKACALGQASSAIMARVIIGSTSSELKALKTTMYTMLKSDGAPPTGKFEEFKFLEPVREYKARHASTLLTFDAVVDAIEQIEAEEKTKIALEKQVKKARQKKAQKAASKALGGAGIKFRVR